MHIHMTDSQKMGNLVREATRKQVSDANYKAAWDLLQNCYHNKRLIVSGFINNIWAIPNINFSSAQTLKKFHDT